MRGAVVLLGAIAIAVGLWVFPRVWFQSPGINDAIWLSDLELPIVAVVLCGPIALLIVGVVRHWPSSAPAALGTFLVGVGVDFVLSLVIFGNTSDDRFATFILLPLPFAAVGLVVVVVAVAIPPRSWGGLLSGGGLGILGAVLLLGWLLARGARDWLLAPYGFDVFLLIALLAALLYWLSATYLRIEPSQR